MGKIIAAFVALSIFVMGIVSISSIQKVPAGYVGVRVYLLGSDKGVDTEELGPGRYWVGFNQELYHFPTHTITYTWTQGSDPELGSPNDESISFQTVEGLDVNTDLGISYRVDPTKVNVLFEKYRKGIDEITDLYLRNMVRDAFVKISSTRKVESVYGAGKALLIEEVQKEVAKQVEPYGIVIEKIYLVGGMRLPNAVIESLNQKIAATQKAQQRENEIQQTKAEAQKVIEEARGNAEAIRLAAEAEAQAIRIKGEAMRENPGIAWLEAIRKWDGQTPKIIGGDIPTQFMRIDDNLSGMPPQ